MSLATLGSWRRLCKITDVVEGDNGSMSGILQHSERRSSEESKNRSVDLKLISAID